MEGIGFMLLFQAVLIALNAIFACAETALISMNSAKIEKLAADGDKRAKRLLKLAGDPAKFLAAIQVAITLAGFLGSAFAAENFSEPLVGWLIGLGVTIPENTLETIAIVVITLILSYFTLVFGELVPKRAAMRKSEGISLTLSRPVSMMASIFSPLVFLLTHSTNFVLRLIGIDPTESDGEVSEEDIRDLVDSGAKNGSIDDVERDFIQNVFEFDDLTAGDIATHRTEVTMLWMDETDEEWHSTIHESCHMFYPVCRESVDDVIGVLYLKDYFRLSEHTRKTVMEKAVKTPYFVPESVKADVLFRNMKSGGKSFAVVLDEYGGMRGIVTMNDLVGQLVGDLGGDDKPSNKPAATLEKTGELVWKLSGNVALDDLAKELSLELPVDDFDTFSGMIFAVLESIPDDGETLSLDAYGMHIDVDCIREHQIESATLTRLEPILSDEEDESDDK